jgi:hypothetical protein
MEYDERNLRRLKQLTMELRLGVKDEGSGEDEDEGVEGERVMEMQEVEKEEGRVGWFEA